MQIIESNRVYLDIYLSSVGKVVCVVNSSAFLPEEVQFEETAYNRFYFPSNITRKQEFALDFKSGVEMKLFCKATSLLSESPWTAYYSSNAFYMTCFHFCSHVTVSYILERSFRLSRMFYNWNSNRVG